MPDQRIQYLCVLDFEATCDSRRPFTPQEIIEFPVVVMDATEPDLPIVAEFHSYVKPLVHPTLTAFCTQLTGIEQSTVDAAPTFPQVYTAFLDFISTYNLTSSNALIITCGDWDLKTMLPSQLVTTPIPAPVTPLLTSWANIKEPFKAKYRGMTYGMKSMLNTLGLELEGRHHSGIDDSRNIAKIVRCMVAGGWVPAPTRRLRFR
ncbi:ERI1 exoribonuclease 3 [Borealophlyctis nickersoniae]|nr:ERI1 exoribonuclease 3 [Borealophlyctis nickersoniae]